ncbi:hypothetical protein N0V94_004299 [Neodidymelliopsis sp. IMI 364377]|nr:hypothetical protein N0V94_004299 [Neodidymelliopsis sp. IMI 364377]
MDVATSIAEVERIIGYEFTDKLLAAESLNHGGLPVYLHNQFHSLRRSEDLAVVGDGLLDTVLRTMWFRARGSQGNILSRGQWDQIRDGLVTNHHLALRGLRLELDHYVTRDPGTRTVSPRMMATTLEAIIAAVFFDTGANSLDAVRAVMDNLGFFDQPLLQVDERA